MSLSGKELVLFNATTVARESVGQLEHLELVLAASVQALANKGLIVPYLDDASRHAKDARIALEKALQALEKSK